MNRDLLKISNYRVAMRLSAVMFFLLLGYFPAVAKTSSFIKYNVQVVSGKVSDDKGVALPGVTILIKGTTNGTVTDKNGYYSINVTDNNAIIQFKFIGFVTQEEQVNGRSVINMIMAPDNNNLNEVVVVAYGVQKKVDLTGAVDQISGKDLQDRPVANVSDALQGMIAGLNVTTNGGGGAPDANKSLNVRGFTGLDGSTAGPLILVDGIETNINSINVNDIASISLLKDVASSAIYGSRAPNGVLLITTKEGKKNQAPELTYTDNFSFAQPLNLPVIYN
jgi:TonB-dependent SusC/RagA subfamily outer membrane receptor